MSGRSFEIRAPRHSEWAVCRMLLPETILDASARDYLLAFDEAHDRIAGAISYRDNGADFINLQLHVVTGFEEARAGSQLLGAVCEEAGKRERSQIQTHADEEHQPALYRFFLENDFRLKRSFSTVEGDMSHAFAYLDRMQSSIDRRAPGHVEIAPLSDLLLSEAGRLFAEYISHLPEQTSTYAYFSGDTEQFGLTQLLLIDGTAQGLMLISRAGETATVHARIVREAHRGGCASAALFFESVKRLREAGIQRLRFQFFDSTRDTAKLAKRLSMQTVSRVDLLCFSI